MGFLSDVGKGLLGIEEQKTSQSYSNRSTQQTQLRPWEEDEKIAYDQAMEGLIASGKAPDPEEAWRQAYERLYGPASQEIRGAYESTRAADYASRAARGAGNTSSSVVRGATDRALLERELGRASSEAGLGASQLALAESADRRATAMGYVDQLNAMWRQRLHGSKIVSTSKGTGESTTSSLPSIGGDIFSAAGEHFGLLGG